VNPFNLAVVNYCSTTNQTKLFKIFNGISIISSSGGNSVDISFNCSETR